MTIAALIAIGVLLGIEVACRLVAWRGKPGVPGHFGIPIASLPAGLAFALTSGVAVADLGPLSMSDPGATSMAAGSTLFATGWFLRYPATWNSKHSGAGAWHSIQSWIARERRFGGSLAVRHQRYVGLSAEAAGIALIAYSPLALAGSACAFIVIRACAQSEEDSAIAKWLARGEKNWPYQIMSDPLLLRTSTWLWLIPAPLLVALFVGFATRELEIFSSDFDTARTLVLSFAGAQGTALLFVFSALIVGMQLIGEGYSWRVVRPVIIWRYRFWVGGLLIGLSTLFDLVVVARASEWLNDGDTAGALVDEAGLMMMLSILFLGGVAFSIAGLLTPEAVITVLLRRLNRRWMDSVERHWKRSYSLTDPRDPMLPVTDVMMGVMTRGDRHGFRACVSSLIQWEERRWPIGESPASVLGYWDDPGQPGEEVEKLWPDSEATDQARAVDNYMHYHLIGLIRRAASDSDPSFLEGLHEFVQAAYRRAHPYVHGDASLFPEGIQGERLLREIVNVCVENGQGAVGESAINGVAFAAERVVKALSPLDGTPFQHDGSMMGSGPSQEQDAREREGDRRIRLLEDGYISYLGETGARAASRHLSEIVEACLRALGSILAQAIRADIPLETKRVVINWAAWRHASVVEEAISQHCRLRYIFSPFRGAIFQVPEGAQHDSLVSILCEHEAAHLKSLWELGRADHFVIEDGIRLLSTALWKTSNTSGLLELAHEIRQVYETVVEGAGSAKMPQIADELERAERTLRRRQLSKLSATLLGVINSRRRGSSRARSGRRGADSGSSPKAFLRDSGAA